MVEHCVTAQGPIIGLVITHVKALRPQGRHEGRGEPVVAVPQGGDVPGAWRPAPDRCEGMDRDQRRDHAGGTHARRRGIDFGAIGRPVVALAARNLCLVDVRIAGDDGAVRDAHHQRRVVAAAIGVDQQARIGCQQGGGTKPRGECARQPSRANVIGDVTGEMVG